MRDGLAFDDRRDTGRLERRLGSHRGRANFFAGQRAFDEDRLAVDPRDAAAFLVQRFDGEQRVGGEGGDGGHGLRQEKCGEKTVKGRELYLRGVERMRRLR